MINMSALRLTPAVLSALASTAMGVDQAATDLQNAYPGVRFHHDQGRLQYVYGTPMTAGADPRDAAANWIGAHGAVFGVGALSVGELWSTPLNDFARTVITYQQYIGGVPVEYGMLKVLVLNGPTARVVYAAGTLAAAPKGGAFPAPAVSAGEAMESIRGQKAWSGLPIWSEPELVVYQGESTWIAPVLTWKFAAENPSPAMAACRTFFVDAATGELVASRNEVREADVTGTVKGMGSPGVLPDIASNPPVQLDMPNILVAVGGGNSAFSSVAGAFVVPHGGTAAVSVSTGVAAPTYGGQWVNIQSGVAAAPNLVATLPGVVPPGPAALLLNTFPSEHTTSQINAFIGITKTHNYFRDRAPGFAGLDVQLRTNTSVSGSCNANFSAGATPPGSSQINMYRAGGSCPNMGFSTILSHEYGHFVVNRLGRSQGAFGEGFGDMMGSMVWDDSVSGREVFGPGTVGRDPIASNIQYPCSSAIHTCGMALSGLWWRVRTNMGAAYGSAAGLELTRSMNVNWALITLGGSGSNAAHPATAIEVLTVDDLDGNLANGTPNYSRICPAFAAHNIQCPAITQNPCYANCDGSTTSPILNVNDFSCFINRYAGGDSYANCDGSTVAPVLNVNDFLCFQTRFAAGCS